MGVCMQRLVDLTLDVSDRVSVVMVLLHVISKSDAFDKDIQPLHVIPVC